MGTDLIENNLELIVKDLLRRVENLEQGSVRVAELSEISADLGLIMEGELRIPFDILDPKEPGEGFSGVRILGEFEYPEGSGIYYAIAGFNNDDLTFGLSAETGEALFCSGNAKIDMDGITFTDLLNWVMRQTATVGSNERRWKIGFYSDGTDPVFAIQYQNTAQVEQLTDGEFDNQFTYWTEGGSESLSDFLISPSYYYSSPYSAHLLTDDLPPQEEPYTEFTDDATLTSDRETISASTNYNLSAYIKSMTPNIDGSEHDDTYIKLEAVWYDDPSAGSELQRDELFNLDAYDLENAFGWTKYETNITSPSGAQSVEIVITYNLDTIADLISAAKLYIYIDNISLAGQDEPQTLTIDDDGVKFNGGSISGGSKQAGWFWNEAVTSVTIDTWYTVDAGVYNGGWRNTTANAADADAYYFYANLAAGTYAIKLIYTKFSYSGIVDTYVNDIAEDTGLDMYAASQSNNNEHDITGITVSGGLTEIKFLINGKNGSSSDYVMAVQRVIIRRTGS